MIQLQVINRILSDKSLALCTLNNLGPEYFDDYKQEFMYIFDHNSKYGCVPDKETFIEHFPDFKMFEVLESPRFLVDALQEDFIYRKSFDVFTHANDIMVNDDSRKAVEYLLSKMPDLTAKLNVEAVDILHEGAQRRFEEYCDKGNDLTKYFISTGLKELDDLIGGWNRASDLVAVCGRPGTGKSWWMDLFLCNAAKAGLTVALYSGEMSESQVGYRIDTFLSNISNFKISKGYSDVFDEYQEHIKHVQESTGKFLVCTPKTLGGVATVPKLKAFCERYKVDILGVDQYSLLKDARGNKGRNERYEAISEDLKALQIELGIPVLVNAQLNRGATSADVSEPGTEHLAGSDRISQDSSIILAITRRPQNKIVLSLTKVREGETGGKLTYQWDIDKGHFEFIPPEQEEQQSNEESSYNEVVQSRPVRRQAEPQKISGGDINF